MSRFLEVYEPVDEGAIDSIKEGVKKVIRKIIELVNNFIDVLGKIKKWIMEKSKEIIAKFKGEREVTVTDTDKVKSAVDQAKDASNALKNGDASKVDDAVNALKDAKEAKKTVTIKSGDQILKHNTETTKIATDIKPCLDNVDKAMKLDDTDPKKSEKLAKALTDTLKAVDADEKTMAQFSSFEEFDKKFSNNEPFEL